KSKVQGPRSKIEIVMASTPPPDMKASLQAALRHIEQKHAPSEADAFLVAPADMPRLSTAIIDRLIELHAGGPGAKVVVPTIDGRRGHPVLFAWSLAGEVFGLGASEGLNVIVER